MICNSVLMGITIHFVCRGHCCYTGNIGPAAVSYLIVDIQVVVALVIDRDFVCGRFFDNELL